MHTADRMTKSKYKKNHCCSPERSIRSTKADGGQEILFRDDTFNYVERLSVLLGMPHMAIITHNDMNFDPIMQMRHEQTILKLCLTRTRQKCFSQNFKTDDFNILINCGESLKKIKVCSRKR